MHPGQFISLAPLLGLALLLTLASVFYVRPIGTAQYGFVIEPLIEPQEGGGLPFAFLVDRPGVSIVHSLGPEDRFRPGWFWLDVACLFAALWGARTLLRKRRPMAQTRSFHHARFLKTTASVFLGLCIATLVYQHALSVPTPLFVGEALFWLQVPSFALAASAEGLLWDRSPWIALALAHLVVALLLGTTVGLGKPELKDEN